MNRHDTLPQYPISHHHAMEYYQYIDQIVTEVFLLPARANMVRTIWDLAMRTACRACGVEEVNNCFLDRIGFLTEHYPYPELSIEYVQSPARKLTVRQLFNNLQHANGNIPFRITQGEYRFMVRYVLQMIELLSGVPVPRHLSFEVENHTYPQQLSKPLSVNIVLPSNGATLEQSIQIATVQRELKRSMEQLYDRQGNRRYLQNVTFNLFTYSAYDLELRDLGLSRNTIIAGSQVPKEQDAGQLCESLNSALLEMMAHIDFSKLSDQHKDAFVQKKENRKNQPEHLPALVWLAQQLPVHELKASTQLQTLQALRQRYAAQLYLMAMTDQAEADFKALDSRFHPIRIEVLTNLFTELFHTISNMK